MFAVALFCSGGLFSDDFKHEAPRPSENVVFVWLHNFLGCVPFLVGLLAFWASDGGRVKRDDHNSKTKLVILTAALVQTVKPRETSKSSIML